MENLFLSDVSVLCGGGAATVRINREEKLNALNSGVLDQLCYVFREIGKAPDIRVAVLTGAGGRAFAAGADLAEIAELGNIEALREYYRQFNILYSIMGEIPHDAVEDIELPVKPKLTSGCEKEDLSVAITKSAARASRQPPPNAQPLTRATIGWGISPMML